MINKSKVFVTQELAGLDYSQAERFGEVVFLTHREMSTARNSIANQALSKDIVDKLNEFDPDIDYVVFSGNPAIAALVFLSLGNRSITQVRLLKWANRDLSYNVINIEVPQ